MKLLFFRTVPKCLVLWRFLYQFKCGNAIDVCYILTFQAFTQVHLILFGLPATIAYFDGTEKESNKFLFHSFFLTFLWQLLEKVPAKSFVAHK